LLLKAAANIHIFLNFLFFWNHFMEWTTIF